MWKSARSDPINPNCSKRLSYVLYKENPQSLTNQAIFKVVAYLGHNNYNNYCKNTGLAHLSDVKQNQESDLTVRPRSRFSLSKPISFT